MVVIQERARFARGRTVGTLCTWHGALNPDGPSPPQAASTLNDSQSQQDFLVLGVEVLRMRPVQEDETQPCRMPGVLRWERGQEASRQLGVW